MVEVNVPIYQRDQSFSEVEKMSQATYMVQSQTLKHSPNEPKSWGNFSSKFFVSWLGEFELACLLA
jgi:hypothetical protein